MPNPSGILFGIVSSISIAHYWGTAVEAFTSHVTIIFDLTIKYLTIFSEPDYLKLFS